MKVVSFPEAVVIPAVQRPGDWQENIVASVIHSSLPLSMDHASQAGYTTGWQRIAVEGTMPHVL